jgi:2-polyprenyl-3-methyl-5-hydroxy-6-metoxy-1,4-benzoquinol methylase
MTVSSSQYRELSEEYALKPQEYYEQSRPEMVEFVPKYCKRVLDVGCSAGGFGALLKEAIPGCEVWGAEPDPIASQLASSKLDHVIRSTFPPEDIEQLSHGFDAICFNDVLEHMISPEATLDACKRLLNSGGVVVASIPNILFFYQISEILIKQDWLYVDSGILDRTHLRFFTKKSIIRLFESSGYQIIRMEGINSFTAGGRFGWKYRIANLLTLGHMNDWKYVHFAVQATPKA